MFQNFVVLSLILLLGLNLCVANNESSTVPLVRRDERKILVSTEYGEISAAEIGAGKETYHLQFITLEPNALLLPVLLHSDIVFYVDTGSGTLSWVDDDETRRVPLRRGDVYRLESGTIFFLYSSLEPERKKLRVHSIFSNDGELGFYSSISRMVLGFNKDVLQAAFGVGSEVIEALTDATRPPAITRASLSDKSLRNFEDGVYESVLGYRGFDLFGKKKKKVETFNILEEDPDFKNANGWSSIVTKKKLHALKGSNIGVFMVNLSKGSMMGPHWNPMAAEIGVVISGSGMVRVVGGGGRIRVDEGDAFGVERFRPMAQMAFSNSCFVFMGFSTSVKKNYPQFLAGTRSVLQSLDKEVVALSFGVGNDTVDGILAGQSEAVILECLACAEEEERKLREEEERRREEEERKREEEEAKKREEEEAKKREEEEREREEEAKKREEEEARKKEEEEARKREEEERQREEEEASKREEEAREEEEARKREEEARREEEGAGHEVLKVRQLRQGENAKERETCKGKEYKKNKGHVEGGVGIEFGKLRLFS